jgi:serine/threonine protein kinase
MGYDVEIGHVLDRRFKITGLLSQGGMAKVFRALDLATRGEVAVKVPLMQFESHPTFFSQFQREESIAAALDHPSVIRVIRIDDSDRTRPYIVTELLEGQTLDALLLNRPSIDLNFAVSLVCCLCEAFAYIHRQGVVHRDLKPGNIMCCTDGTLRILDFGLAITPTQRQVAPAGLAGNLGTLVYMAPEQVRGKRGDARVDIYALGSILYEMTTGQKPFSMEDQEEAAMARVTGDPPAPRLLNPNISPELEEIILRAVARDPNLRYPNCEVFKHDLKHPAEVRMAGLAAGLTPPRPYRPLTRLGVKWLALAAIPLVLFALIYVFGRHH